MNNIERQQQNNYSELEQELNNLSMDMLEGFLIDCE